jgi:putative colanic acid biosynthesis acetyltransferase WcaF
MNVDLSKYDNAWFNPGRGVLIRLIWIIFNTLFFQNPLNLSSRLKCLLLRMFGAKVGSKVVLKPSINIKYPWHLEIGDNSWIGENAWLDSLALIHIGKNCCISQGAHICTGNHKWDDEAFGLIVNPVVVEDGVWVGAQSIILPGVTLQSHSVITAGSAVSKDTDPYTIYRGNPALPCKKREIKPARHRDGATFFK